MSKSTVVSIDKGGKPKPKPKSTGYKSCYHSHPALEIAEGVFIYGGNCREPVVKDADIYIGLDGSSMAGFRKQLPWYPEIAFTFRITDMSPPSSVEEFKKLLEWLSEQLAEEKKIHIGCIGGHGRTGLVFSALRNALTGDPDSTTYVRKNYCHKAVESQEQINWLHKHFGIKKVKPTKSYQYSSGKGHAGQKTLFGDDWNSYTSKNYGTETGRFTDEESMDLKYVPTEGNVWGKNAPKK